MDAQKELLRKMMFGPLPGNLASILYPRRLPEDVTYMEAAYMVGEPNLFLPDDGRRCFQHDVILLFQHVVRQPNGLKRMFKDSVSIEIKTTPGNTIDSTVHQYVGATRLFFIAAPEALLPVVLCKVHEAPQRQVIGLIDGDAGQIVVLPQYQNYDRDRQDRLLAQCYLSKNRLPVFNEQELFSPHRVHYPTGGPAGWIWQDGLRLNPDYLDLYATEAANGFNLERYRHDR